MTPATFPCHPESEAAWERGGWQACATCGSLLRTQAARRVAYDEGYARGRGHYDPEIGACKAQTLERWLGELAIDARGQVVCEVGFGGGWCLPVLARRGAFVLGLEPVAANRAHAASLGIPAERLFDVEPLPPLPRRPTLWLFQDSFEHVEDPAALASWMAEQSATEGARVVIVAPDGASRSRRWMGRFWVHNTPDHWVHYSEAGVQAIMERAGFRMERRFRPQKRVLPETLGGHLGLLLSGGRGRPPRLPRWPLWFNVGEMGLVLGSRANRSQAAR